MSLVPLPTSLRTLGRRANSSEKPAAWLSSRGRTAARRIALCAGASLMSAGLIAAAEVLPGCSPLILVSLVPFLAIVHPDRLHSTWVALALLYGAYSGLSVYWISYWAPGFAAVLPLVFVYAGVWVVMPAFCCWLLTIAARPADPSVGWLVLPASWVLMESMSRRLLLCAVWTTLGQPLTDCPILTQAAGLGGPETLSYLVVAVSVACVVGFRRKAGRLSRALAILQGPGVLILVSIWGASRPDDVLAGDQARIKVAVIQPGADSTQWSNADYRRSTLEHCDRLIDGVTGEKPDMIVIPESVICGFVRYESDLTEWVRGTVKRTRLPLLFSALDHPEGNLTTCHNAAILITPYGTVSTYAKRRLVPMSEYVPSLGPLSGMVRSLRGDRLEYSPGESANVFDLRGRGRFSPLICYEDVYAELARESAQGGAQLLVTLGNLSRFGDSCAGRQQLRRAQLTAASVGLPMVRCTNSGISCAIDARGRVSATLSDERGRVLMVEGARVFEVPLARISTLYRAYGDWLAAGVLGLGIAAAIGISAVLRRC